MSTPNPTLMAQATTAICAALSQAPAVAPRVDRARLRPLAANTTTAVVVRPIEAQASDRTLGGMPIQWACQFAVECYAKTTTTTAPDAAVDALLASAYARLMADATLGGTVNFIHPVGVSYDFDVDGEQTACAVLTFEVRQTTQTPNVF